MVLTCPGRCYNGTAARADSTPVPVLRSIFVHRRLLSASARYYHPRKWGCSDYSARGPWRREAFGVTIAAIIGVGNSLSNARYDRCVYRQSARCAAIRSRLRLMPRLRRLGLLPYAHLHLAKRSFECIVCCDCLLRAAFKLLTVPHTSQHAESLC